MITLERINALAVAGKPIVDIMAATIIITLMTYLIIEYNPYDKNNIQQLV